MKQQTIRVDQPTPCYEPANRDVFDDIISMTVAPSGKSTERKRLRKAVAHVRPLCAACPERVQCWEVHGDDFNLGVIAGLTDMERAARLGGVA